MRRDKGVAIQLRKEGKSYSEIHTLLRVPKATLSDWFSKKEWSLRVRKRLTEAAKKVSTARIIELDRIRGSLLKEAYKDAASTALDELASLKYHPLFIAGLMIHWGEGDKRTKNIVRIANTDPEMIRLFVFFLRHLCHIPEGRIRGYVLIYPDLNAEKCLDFWSKNSGLTKDHFSKCVSIQGRHKTNRLAHGVCTIAVSSTYFKVKVNEWLRVLPQELMNRAYYENI